MKTLSRIDLKQIKGGVEDAGHCLYCTGDGGSCGSSSEDCYYRANTSGDATAICKGIYSGCTAVAGYYAACESQCEMN